MINKVKNNLLKFNIPFLPKLPEHKWGLEVEDIEYIKE